VREKFKTERNYKNYHQKLLPVKTIKAHQVKTKTKKVSSLWKRGGRQWDPRRYNVIAERRIRLFIVGCYLII
jgi:hypothetical protein